jgi:uracil-DNA glycosylase
MTARGARMKIPESWVPMLGHELQQPYYETLARFVADERSKHDVFPADAEVFAALERTPFDRVRIVLLGQDPYPTPGHAHGLCFSVRDGVKPPASLQNMYKELERDLGVPIAPTGNLGTWADRGMLLLNTVLTVRSKEANSHQKQGWETFTDAVLRALSARERPMVFVLWGTAAKKKEKILDASRHRVVMGAHPSPLSIKHFQGSKPFSKIDDALRSLGEPPFDWRL